MATTGQRSWCGKITEQQVGTEIMLQGWVHQRRDLGGLIFFTLRDRTGLIQIIVDDQALAAVKELAQAIRSEFVVQVTGTVAKRSAQTVNQALATGSLEVIVKTIEILNKSKLLPFSLSETSSSAVSEETRLTYRYLDLRRPFMQEMLRLRHELCLLVRSYLDEHGFYEIETPLLTRNTMEGAKEFIVPSSVQQGFGYALPQSPQMYKQLLMAAGFERYFQIARCFRDEALRANRQPEFTQIDMELSFVNEEDIFSVCEGLFQKIFKKFLNKDLERPFTRYTYDYVFKTYGSDKPDLRFDMPVYEVTRIFSACTSGFIQDVLKKGGSVGLVCIKNKQFSRKEIDDWTHKARNECKASGLATLSFKSDGSLSGSLAKQCSSDIFTQLKTVITDLTYDDTLFIVADTYQKAWSALGQLRVKIAKELGLIDQTKEAIFWVIDFPSFEWNEELHRWQACHHPFTSPQAGWEALDLKDVKARAYDLVWNGEEAGGGSIRIHDYEVQKKIFSLLGLTPEQTQEHFGFLLEAMQMGYPPEGGIAFGLDRLLMNITRAESIRDVIAFPKTNKGTCLMMQTPSLTEDEDLMLLGLTKVKK